MSTKAADESEHRPVEVGKTYTIDAGRSTMADVVVVACYGKYFCMVRNPASGYEWETMCYRLTEPLNQQGR